MALETVPKDLRHLRACLLCSLVKVSVGDLVVGTTGEAEGKKEGEMAPQKRKRSESSGDRQGNGKPKRAVVYVGGT